MYSLLLLLGLASTSWGAVVIEGPTEPVDPKEYTMILVSGLSDVDLPKAKVAWSPTAGVTVMPAKTWGGQPMLFFKASTPGKYTLSITINEWVEATALAANSALAAQIPEAAELQSLAKSLSSKYPYSQSTCVVEVAGSVPPPPPPPDVPPISGKVQSALILVDSDNPGEELGRQLNMLRNDKLWGNKLIEILEKRTEDENGQPSAKVAAALQYLGSKPLPRVVGFGPSGPVCEAEMPATAKDTFALLIQWGMKP
jgi:hypothetical protein